MVDLTNADVADILALLDSLPYDSLDVQTPRFRLTLRRAPGGGWTEESQVLAEPALIQPAPRAGGERAATAAPAAAAGAGTGAREAGGAAGAGQAGGSQLAASVTGDSDGADRLAVVAA